MSLELLLIPVGLAAYTAWKEASSTALCEKCKSTRVTDADLLAQALVQMGAADIYRDTNRLTASTRHGDVTFQRIGEVFLGRVDKAAEETTMAMLSELEHTVGRLVQARSVEQLRARAHELGLSLVAETADDGTVQLVFEAS